MIVIVAAVVVLLLVHQATVSPPAGTWLGGPPVPGGADGSPQSQTAYQHGGGPVGNSTNAKAHNIESAIGAVGGAGVCAYFGAGVAAPACAKVGAFLAPKAVALGNFTTIKTLQAGEAVVGGAGFAINKVTSLGTNIASKGATYADRAYAGAGKLPGPLSYVGKASVAPIKIVADVGAIGAKGVQAGAGALASGTKAATHAVTSGVKKVLGWL